MRSFVVAPRSQVLASAAKGFESEVPGFLSAIPVKDEEGRKSLFGRGGTG
jgi:hypothetical protein